MIKFINELKPCPFCGAEIRIDAYRQTVSTVEVECHCTRCNMHFKYEQDFMFSSVDRVPIQSSFVNAWNRRANDGEA